MSHDKYHVLWPRSDAFSLWFHVAYKTNIQCYLVTWTVANCETRQDPHKRHVTQFPVSICKKCFRFWTRISFKPTTSSCTIVLSCLPLKMKRTSLITFLFGIMLYFVGTVVFSHWWWFLKFAYISNKWVLNSRMYSRTISFSWYHGTSFPHTKSIPN